MSPRPACDLVVVGGSAGGVVALQHLLRALPRDFPHPIVAVLHVAPDRPSGLAQLLAQQCALRVVEAVDKQPIEHGAVYLAPPNYHLLVEPDLTLALSVDPPVLYSRPAIDPLFESAAEACGAALLAVLLTGASHDGTDGLAAVRAHGGRAWVQDPDTAAAATMPAHALARVGADAVLSLDAIASRLALLSTTE